MRATPTWISPLRVGPCHLAEGTEGRALSGRTFVAKDVFDIAGMRVGAGNPTWLAEARPAQGNALAIDAWLAAGAELIGQAHTDDLTYSLAGTNPHYGTPANPAAPGRVPGGSSSGSASAVASGLCDLALGTDTGGSIRVPASYCGIIGFRPTHGRTPLTGVVGLAPSFDTVGCFARHADLLAEGACALLGSGPRRARATTLVIIDELLALVDQPVANAVRRAARAFGDELGLAVEVASIPGGDPDVWFGCFRTLQGAEAWDLHGPWITAREPALAPGVSARFAAGRTVDGPARERATHQRAALAEETNRRFGPNVILVVPSAAGPAPPLTLATVDYNALRARTLRITSVAGLLGWPALSLPIAEVDGLPLGICLIGARGSDEELLDLACRSSLLT